MLAQAKAASGGAAWDALRTQHSKVSILTGADHGLRGAVERVRHRPLGSRVHDRARQRARAGFDGRTAWSQDASGKSQAETGDAARELAVNAAYRDRLAFWYPERAPGRIAYKERAEADGASFDVIRITPEGGRPFELWINTETKLIERLVEREAQATRTELYMDMRDVAGVKIPFRVRASRGERAPRRVRDRRAHGVQRAADRRAFCAARPAEARLRVSHRAARTSRCRSSFTTGTCS